MSTAPESWRGRTPACQRRGTNRFEVMRQVQKSTASQRKVTDRPFCPEALFVVILLFFKWFPSTLELYVRPQMYDKYYGSAFRLNENLHNF